MARIPAITRREELAPADQGVWDAIARSRGHVVGPFTVLLRSPRLAERIGHLGAHVRFESGLAPVDREIAILTVAREMDCGFEWAAHVVEARKAGVRPEVIDAIRARTAPAGLTPDEAAIHAYACQTLRAKRVDAPTFAAARARLGDTGLVELTTTVGYYTMLACTLNAFEIAPPPEGDALPA
jgi:4-carboxymuconolactone decarboxylase